jgi:UDP-N-acetylmuramyl pentapeptide phosphotransferase/UDP-N-acetylglucosamine-1-phosphate transferase
VIDSLFGHWMIAAPFTVLAVSGFTHAVNIADGLNGLAGGLIACILVLTGLVGLWTGDTFIAYASLVVAAALAGFLLINYPRGWMFLGDGGAYSLGFVVAMIWIMLLVRNPEISPWLLMVLGAYPATETLFSIYRRRFHSVSQGEAMVADRLHLHSLLYRRWARPLLGSIASKRAPWAANALAAMLIVQVSAVPMLIGALAYDSNAVCAGIYGLYVVAYLSVFWRLVRFQPIVGSVRTSLAAVSSVRDAVHEKSVEAQR